MFDFGSLNPMQYTDLLRKIDYPKQKYELIDAVLKFPQGEKLASLLEKLPDREYKSEDDVQQSLKKAA